MCEKIGRTGKMRICDLLKKAQIDLGAAVRNKEEAIDRMISLAEKSGAIRDREEFRQAILEREKLGSTALEKGICVFHAKSEGVERPVLCAMTLTEGIDCGSMDGKPTDFCFMIGVPKDSEIHLKVLSQLLEGLMDEAFRDSLKKAKTPEEFISLVEKNSCQNGGEILGDAFDVLAVTACPNGIAHTYMAAKALEKAAEEMNLCIKVETNGSAKTENILTEEEIRQAKGIIVAADTRVETKRFAGKPVLMVPVSEGITKPKELLGRVLGGEVPVMEEITVKKNQTTASTVEKTGRDSFGHQLYTHLMNGITYMLPFIIGGGILMAIAFLLDDYSINPANFGMNTPVAAFFKTLGSLSFDFMLPIFAGYIAYSIADRPGFAAGAVGGFLAKVGNSFSNITGENAVSGGFLAALLAGFAAGYIVLLIEKLADHLPESLDGIKPMLIYPLLGILLTGLLMFAINPLMASINNAIVAFLNSMGGSSKVLLGCIVGGMMSIDMGGPFNKAAYVFATASLASGQADIMAAVMLGGMVPPLAIALATTFFKKKFTADQRKSGLACYIMGLCFITESMIPFGAADPLRVISSCTVGSAVAGGLSMFLGCTLTAPHGGVFVFPIAGNPLGYAVSLAAGAVVGMLMMGLLKKNVPEENTNK